MNFFLFTFFLIYGSAHGYFLIRASQGLALSRGASVGLSFWLLMMVIAPLAVRMIERDGHEAYARLIAYAGYCWMGFLFLWIVMMLVMDLARLFLQCAGRLVPVPDIQMLAPAPAFMFCLVIAVILSLYSMFEASRLTVEKIEIRSSKLPPGSPAIRVVQISDLHLGLIVREKHVRKVVEVIKQSRPDLLVATGDIVDGHVSHFDGVSSLFRELTPPLGMIAIPGNHEYYAGIGESRRFLQDSGFRFLRAEGVSVGKSLWVAGIDDPAARRSGDFRDNEKSLLATAPQDRFLLLLKHRPLVEHESLGRFDLQLSGHVHKGQIAPFNLFTWIQFPVKAGLNRLDNGCSYLYVNRGTGTWGPPMRLLAPPEVTVIDILPTSTSWEAH